MKREDVILMAGCGNSRLTEEMFEDGNSRYFIASSLYIFTPIHDIYLQDIPILQILTYQELSSIS